MHIAERRTTERRAPVSLKAKIRKRDRTEQAKRITRERRHDIRPEDTSLRHLWLVRFCAYSATSRLSHLLRTVPPSITCQAAANYDALVEWALASIIAGDGTAAAGLPTPEEVAHDPTVCQNQTYLGHDAPRQAHLPIREGGLGLTSSSSIKGAAYIGCHALVLGRVVAASARGNLPSLLERLPERPMASALLEELKIVVTEAKRSQIEDAVGSSWAALAAEENPQGRGIGTLLVEVGAGGGGGGGGGVGAGVLDSENNGRIRWQPSLIGR